MEKKNVAGTAQDTVGHPGIHTPIKAKTTNKQPSPKKIRDFTGLLVTAYFSIIDSTVCGSDIQYLFTIGACRQQDTRLQLR